MQLLRLPRLNLLSALLRISKEIEKAKCLKHPTTITQVEKLLKQLFFSDLPDKWIVEGKRYFPLKPATDNNENPSANPKCFKVKFAQTSISPGRIVERKSIFPANKACHSLEWQPKPLGLLLTPTLPC